MVAAEEAFHRLIDELDLGSEAGQVPIGEVGGFPISIAVCSQDPPEVWVRYRARDLIEPTLPLIHRSALGVAASPLRSADDVAPRRAIARALESGSAELEVHGPDVLLTLKTLDAFDAADVVAIVRDTAVNLRDAGNCPPTSCQSCGTSEGLAVRTDGVSAIRLCDACDLERRHAYEQREVLASAWLGADTLHFVRDAALAGACWPAYWLAHEFLLRVAGFKATPFAVHVLVSALLFVSVGTRLGRSARRWRGISGAVWVGILTALVLALVGEVLVAAGLFAVDGFTDDVLRTAAENLGWFVSIQDAGTLTVKGIQLAALVGGVLSGAARPSEGRH